MFVIGSRRDTIQKFKKPENQFPISKNLLQASDIRYSLTVLTSLLNLSHMYSDISLYHPFSTLTNPLHTHPDPP